ncbi:MAG: hypothetical protein HY364_01575 [Candidatus Aenigmarchaeota archaeon]|nr:hypothetical protein [Candidatus Aenigmarchaeota archaeon]
MPDGTRDYGFGSLIDKLLSEGYEIKTRHYKPLEFDILTAPVKNFDEENSDIHDMIIAYANNAIIGAKRMFPGVNIPPNQETFTPTEAYAIQILGDVMSIHTSQRGRDVITQAILGILPDTSNAFHPENPEAYINFNNVANGTYPNSVAYHYDEEVESGRLPNGSTLAMIYVVGPAQLLQIASNGRIWEHNTNRRYRPKEVAFPYTNDAFQLEYFNDGNNSFGVDMQTGDNNVRITGRAELPQEYRHQIRSALESGPYIMTEEGLAVPDRRWLNLAKTHPLISYEMRSSRQ